MDVIIIRQGSHCAPLRALTVVKQMPTKFGLATARGRPLLIGRKTMMLSLITADCNNAELTATPYCARRGLQAGDETDCEVTSRLAQQSKLPKASMSLSLRSCKSRAASALFSGQWWKVAWGISGVIVRKLEKALFPPFSDREKASACGNMYKHEA